MSNPSPPAPSESAPEPSESAKPAPRRSSRWWRLSLRTLLIAAPVAAVLLGMGIRWYLPRYLERRAVEEVERLGGTIVRDGDSGFVVGVELPGKNITDERLRLLVPHLKNLPHLRDLVLVSNDVGDEGLLLLAELEQLQRLFVAGTKVTDAGVARLQAQRGGLTIDRFSPHGRARALARRDIYQHAILHLAMAPGGRQILAGCGDGKLRVWDLASGEMLRAVQVHGDWAFTAELHPSGRWLATGGGDNLVKFWSWPELTEIGRLTGHTGDVHAIGFTPDGSRLVSAGDDRSVRFWDVATRRELAALDGHEGSIPGLAISPRGDLAATASRDGTVRLWSIPRPRSLARPASVAVLSGHTDDVMSVAFRPNGKELASASYDGTVRVWNVSTQRSLSRDMSHTECGTTYSVSRDWLFAVAWSPSGEELMATAGDGARMIDRMSGRKLWTSSEQENVSHALWLNTGEVATSAADASIAVHYAATGKQLSRMWSLVSR
jgi:WD40 repeat protein